jgi:hypothetical protein
MTETAGTAVPGRKPAPGTLRSELEAMVKTWREESEPYPEEDAAEIGRRGGFGYCAGELAQVLAAHPGTRSSLELKVPAVAAAQAAYEALHASIARRQPGHTWVAWDSVDEVNDGIPGEPLRQDLEAATLAAIAAGGWDALAAEIEALAPGDGVPYASAVLAQVARAVVARLTGFRPHDEVQVGIELDDADGARLTAAWGSMRDEPGQTAAYWVARAALTTAVRALQLVKLVGSDDLAAKATKALAEVDEIMAREPAADEDADEAGL